ncbi:ABC transporter permease [Mucilaginibacter sp. UYCu711]|uniref:ABC transporter permease n=1 Tax=Mucilaginibacter sp. UYCu711 TaxID=3156339 RepID=UPI003D1947E7
MIRSYLKIALRNLLGNKTISFINIGGLAMGMAVAILIGLWIWDELSFNKYHQNYDRIAQVMENNTRNGTISTSSAIPLPLDAEMRKTYAGDFKHIVMQSWADNHVISMGDKNITYRGTFIGAEGPEMFTVDMISGNRGALHDPSSILISQSVAKALFGDADPLSKVIKLDDKADFKVAGVYADLPDNTTLHDVAFMAPWDFYANQPTWIGRGADDWSDNSLFMYVQIADNADMSKLSEKIKNVKLNRVGPDLAKAKPTMFLQPMSKWHLFSQFKNGVNTGGAIQYVWLFGLIGIAVLLLACINFMNLSTARNEKRAKEVGLRKAIGSLRGQLVMQFFFESLCTVILSFILSIILVALLLPYFNQLCGKQLSILWDSSLFWAVSIGFTLFTGLIAGSYPALYLSSFNPVKVLKGTFKAGPLAAIPRKVLVVTQFTVSVVLIIGTIVIFKQVQFAQDRPVGYSRDGLVAIETTNGDLHNHFDAFRLDLLKSGAVDEVAESSSPATAINNFMGGISWKGKDPAMAAKFANVRITTEFGKTIGFKFVRGRDFSRQLTTDSSAVVINEAAVKYMGIKNPVGETIQTEKKALTVIGVAKDMVMSSPYEPAQPTIFYLQRRGFDYVDIRLNPKLSAHEALAKVEAICKVYSPSVPFAYKFADDEYAAKFTTEQRVGSLAKSFAALAILISCLGLFGMASFMAEQRRKEIGVRKVLGASIIKLLGNMTTDFIVLIAIALLIAFPLAYYFMHNWLQAYTYRTSLSWWIFAVTAAGTVVITLLTVSYQSIKAALANPVKSLRSE